MNVFRKKVYQFIPSKLQKSLGRSTFLRPLRNLFFRKEGSYIESSSKITRSYQQYSVDFDFFASIQVAVKAEKKGMENSLIRSSIKLVDTYKKSGNRSIVFDVGANFGYLSLVWAQSIASSGKVFSFEPHPKIFKSFKKSIESNHLHRIIEASNLAVGKNKGIIELSTTTATSNTLPMEWEEKMTQKLSIPIITLDQFMVESKVSGCDLIKIDVDGIEFEILEGAVQLINTYQPIVIVETNNDQRIIEHMEKLDYIALDGFLKPLKSGNRLPPNAFFVPNSLYPDAL